ncbi:MAG: glycosyltransferase family 39 protein [Chthoniobacteraceae bacterium]
MDALAASHRWKIRAFAAALLLLGCALRIVPWTSFQGMGYDESWYRKYLLALDAHGLAAYPDICAAYLADGADQQTLAKVPPLRVLFVTSGWMWKRAAFGSAAPADLDAPGGTELDPALISLHRVSTVFGCIALIAAWALARRFFAQDEALGVLALFSCSPLLIHISQHALIDGVYGTCALLTLWTLIESLRTPVRPTWLAAFASSFALLVLAKENAIFVGAAIAAILCFARPLGLGAADRRHWSAAILGGLAAIAILAWAAGGFATTVAVYLLFIGKVQTLTYGHETGDGGWSRYLVDLMIFTPVTLCFALGGAFRTATETRGPRVFLVFLGITYIAMCNVRYGMNLRYATIWEFPLRVLAVAQVTALASRFERRPWIFAAFVVMLCAVDLAQYHHFFVTYRLYDLPTGDMLRTLKMLK